jgi:hypothetical protein
MRNLTAEQILILVLFIVLPLLNWIFQHARRRPPREPLPPYNPDTAAPQRRARERITVREYSKPVAGTVDERPARQPLELVQAPRISDPHLKEPPPPVRQTAAAGCCLRLTDCLEPLVPPREIFRLGGSIKRA